MKRVLRQGKISHDFYMSCPAAAARQQAGSGERGGLAPTCRQSPAGVRGGVRRPFPSFLRLLSFLHVLRLLPFLRFLSLPSFYGQEMMPSDQRQAPQVGVLLP